jgi:regulator of RNase E activity RraA
MARSFGTAGALRRRLLPHRSWRTIPARIRECLSTAGRVACVARDTAMTTLTERLARCYTGAVHDVLRMMGQENIVLPPAIKAIAPGTKIAGPVWTVSGHVDRTKTRHETLLGWCTLLAKAPAGHVVVCQPNNHEVALMGELSAQTLAARGVLGYVVDGGSRDTDLVLAQGFPVFCSFLTPSDVVARWIPDRYGEPVTIGSVTISTGDYLLGDRDGVVIVPRSIAEEVVTKTEEVVATESEMRGALIGGMDPVEAYNRYGKF